MATVKQPRKGQLLQQEVTPEIVLEQQVLHELQGLRGQVRDLRTILMGAGDDGETQYGRLPMVEAQVKRLRDEVDDLLKMRTSAGAYWNAARILAHVATAIVGGAALLIGQQIMKFFFGGP